MTKDRPDDERPASEIILYQTTKQNISLHVRNILSEGELEEVSVVKNSLTTAADGELEAEATCKDYLQVQSEGTRQVEYRSFLPIGPAGDDIGPTTQTGVLLRESA